MNAVRQIKFGSKGIEFIVYNTAMSSNAVGPDFGALHLTSGYVNLKLVGFNHGGKAVTKEDPWHEVYFAEVMLVKGSKGHWRAFYNQPDQGCPHYWDVPQPLVPVAKDVGYQDDTWVVKVTINVLHPGDGACDMCYVAESSEHLRVDRFKELT